MFDFCIVLLTYYTNKVLTYCGSS